MCLLIKSWSPFLRESRSSLSGHQEEGRLLVTLKAKITARSVDFQQAVNQWKLLTM